VSSNIVKFSLVNLSETYPNVKFRAFNKTISMSHYIPARVLVEKIGEVHHLKDLYLILSLAHLSVHWNAAVVVSNAAREVGTYS
jgi:hypothetical protein